MAERNEPSDADARALLEEAEAQAAAAEAKAAAAQARARLARLRREARKLQEPGDDYDDEDYDETADEDYEYYDEYDEDVDAAEGASEPAGWRRRTPMIVALAAIILTIAFTGLSAYMVFEHRDTTKHRQREAAFVAGAKQGVVNMISIHFDKAQEDVQRVIDSSTGPFKDDFQQRAKDLIAVTTQSKVISDGTVNGAAIESMDQNSAVVLVAATSRVTNSVPGKDEPPRIWRLKVTVAEVDGQYKMSKVEYLA
jgi:Mce-associated membrane protein